MIEHPFTIEHSEQSGAFSWRFAEARRARWARLMQRGQRINAELLAFAAASRARLEAIDREFPELPDDTT